MPDLPATSNRQEDVMSRAKPIPQPEETMKPANDAPAAAPATNEPESDAFKALQLSKMIRAKEELASASGTYRNIVKNAEAKGIDRKAALKAIQIKDSEKRDEFVAELRNTLDYLAVLGVGIDPAQRDLFRVTIDPRTPLEERAWEDGLRAGRLAEGTDENPHHPSTEAHQRWMDGFHQGTADRKAILSMEAEETAPLIQGAGHDGDEGEDGGSDE